MKRRNPEGSRPLTDRPKQLEDELERAMGPAKPVMATPGVPTKKSVVRPREPTFAKSMGFDQKAPGEPVLVEAPKNAGMQAQQMAVSDMHLRGGKRRLR
jgi:hypothetical protein